MGTATLFTSGATSAATFSVEVAAAPQLFSSPAKSDSAVVFLAEKVAALQRPIFSKYSAATGKKLLPRLFRFTFSHVTVWSLYSPLFFTLLLLPRYFSLVERTKLPL